MLDRVTLTHKPRDIALLEIRKSFSVDVDVRAYRAHNNTDATLG